MGKIALLCAGQGSQYPGMGKDLYDDSKAIAEFFQEAESIRPGTLSMMWEGSVEDLKRTDHTQPALFLADYAAVMALAEAGITPDGVAGFSLGEIVGLAASGILPATEAFRLVCRRGELMQEAATKVQGGMLAVLRCPKEELEALCEEVGVYPVNYNCPGQIVVSGTVEKIGTMKEALTERKVRFVELAVGGPFHTPYMQSASDGLRTELQNGSYHLSPGKCDLYGNQLAAPYPQSVEEMVERIALQASHSVRFEDTLNKMAQEGFDTFIECGPGTTLSGLVKKTLKDVRIYQVSDVESLGKTLEALKGDGE